MTSAVPVPAKALEVRDRAFRMREEREVTVVPTCRGCDMTAVEISCGTRRAEPTGCAT